MPSLKEWLASNPSAGTPVGHLDAPELGDGVRIHLRRLTLGEFRTIVDGPADKGIDRMASALPLCVCEEDGSAWSGPDLVTALPLAVASRVVNECLRLNSLDVSEAKKASSPTP